MKKTEILKLYQSILTGASQCHLTGINKIQLYNPKSLLYTNHNSFLVLIIQEMRNTVQVDGIPLFVLMV